MFELESESYNSELPVHVSLNAEVNNTVPKYETFSMLI